LATQARQVVVVNAKPEEQLQPDEISWDQLLNSIPSEPAPIELNADAGALIIFTSGTTGTPKGVLLTHGNLAANTASIQAYLDIQAADTAMCVLPFFYSYGNSVLHTHLTRGCTIVLENSFMYPQQVIASMSK